MSMMAAIRSAWALLFGLALIMLGNGLQGTLLGVRASIEQFPTTVTGLVMTGYFAGFLAGSMLVPIMLRNVGHIRVFTALASLASAAAVLHSVFVDPWSWGIIRTITGFCLAGLYVVSESWLNDAATNETRGQLLSVYMVVVLGGMGLGQLLLNAADPASFELFVLISVLVSVAVVPIALSVSPAPRFEAPDHVGVRKLYAVSPLGVVGCFLVGASHGSFFSMGAVYAKDIGLSVLAVSYFVAMVLLGGVILQWPIGRLSDRFDRRQIITGVSLFAAIVCIAATAVSQSSLPALMTLMFFFGGLCMPLYSLCIAHTNDYLEPAQMVAASASLVLVAGAGALFGPFVTGVLMSLVGPDGFFAFQAVAVSFIGFFALWRMTRRSARPVDKQRHYETLAPETSPIVATIVTESLRDHKDRDLARLV